MKNKIIALSKNKVIETLVLIVTKRCFMNCKYCIVKREKEKMSKAIAIKSVELYLEYIKNRDNPREFKIKFFGGEPLLMIGLLKKIVACIKKKQVHGVKFQLPTNGVLLNKDILSWANNNKIELSVSIDITKLLKIDSIGKVHLMNTYNNFFQLRDYYPNDLVINLCIPPHNPRAFFSSLTYLYNTGFRRFNFLPTAYFLWPDNALKIFSKELSKVKTFLKENYGNGLYLKNLHTYAIQEDEQEKMYLFDNDFIIDCNGDIFLTSLFMSDIFCGARKKTLLGNVSRISSLEQIRKKNILLSYDKFIGGEQKNVLESNYKLNEIIDRFVVDFRRDVSSIKKQDNKKIFLNLGLLCNNRCRFCIYTRHQDNLLNQHKDNIKKAIGVAAKTARELIFTGGEPTVRADIIELIRCAKVAGIKNICIHSNGRRFFYGAFCEGVIGAGANKFIISVHGHRKEIHDYLTSIEGSFEQTIEGIKNLKNMKQVVYSNTVITARNYKYLKQTAELLISLGVGKIQFLYPRILSYADREKDRIIVSKTQVAPYLKEALDFESKNGGVALAYGISYCLLPGHDKFLVTDPMSWLEYCEYELKDRSKSRVDMIKGLNCAKCKHDSICNGFDKEYVDYFGWDEFKPVLK